MLRHCRHLAFRVGSGVAHINECITDHDLAEHVRERFAAAGDRVSRAGAARHEGRGVRVKVAAELMGIVEMKADIVGPRTITSAMAATSKINDESTTMKLFHYWTRTRGEQALPQMYVFVMAVQSYNGRVANVAAAIKDMLALPNTRMCEKSYFYLLRSLTYNGLFDEALRVLRTMTITGAVRVDGHCLSAVLAGCTTHAQLEEMGLWRYKRLLHDQGVVEALMGVYARTGDARRAERLLKECIWKKPGQRRTRIRDDRSLSTPAPDATGVENDDATVGNGAGAAVATRTVWHNLMKVYRTTRDAGEVHRAWRRMARRGIAPGAATYHIYISTLCALATVPDDPHVTRAEGAFNHAAAADLLSPVLWSDLLRCYDRLGDGEKFSALLAHCPKDVMRSLPVATKDIIDIRRERRGALDRKRSALRASDAAPRNEAATS